MNYDFSNFHKECKNKGLVMGNDGLCVYCLDCGICANVESVSAKISPGDAVTVNNPERVVLGKQSPNVHKGGSK